MKGFVDPNNNIFGDLWKNPWAWPITKFYKKLSLSTFHLVTFVLPQAFRITDPEKDAKMIEHYKAIGAMIALNDFTIEELNRFSGVSITAISKVVESEEDSLEEIKFRSRSRSGTDEVRYQIKADKFEFLKYKMRDLYNQLPKKSEKPEASCNNKRIPAGLLVAEDILNRLKKRFPRREKKIHLLNLARRSLEGACSEFASFSESVRFNNKISSRIQETNEALSVYGEEFAIKHFPDLRLIKRSELTQHILRFQRGHFKNTLKAIENLYCQIEKLNELWGETLCISEKERRIINQWSPLFKKGFDNLKLLIDENFDELESIYADLSK